jgi:hypothetical protein
VSGCCGISAFVNGDFVEQSIYDYITTGSPHAHFSFDIGTFNSSTVIGFGVGRYNCRAINLYLGDFAITVS